MIKINYDIVHKKGSIKISGIDIGMSEEEFIDLKPYQKKVVIDYYFNSNPIKIIPVYSDFKIIK